MGTGYGIKCADCNYSIRYLEGVGMFYDDVSVFYNNSQNDKPWIHSLIKNKRIKDKAVNLLSNGALPDNEYGHELYACPKCNRLTNRFYFKLVSSKEEYEPDYRCYKCKTKLLKVELQTNKKRDFAKIVFKNNSDKKWNCPKCGCEKLVYDNCVTNWD